MIFTNPDGLRFTFNQMVDEIIKWTAEYPEEVFSYVVATDSQVHKVRRKPVWYTQYVTIVWVHRGNHGGRIWILQDKVNERIGVIQRLMHEVELSIDVMNRIAESKLKSRLEQFSVHIDVGENGLSRSVVQACLGWVMGLGFNAEVKPEAVGASCVADFFSK